MARDAKTRQHNRKRAHKELGARRTEASRKRRLDNKAKRDEIHAIDPIAKVKIIDQKTFIDVGYLVEVDIIDGAIVTIPVPGDEVNDYGVIIDKPVTIKVQTNEQKMAEIGMIPSSLPEGAIKTECDFEDAVIEYQEVMDEEECIKALDFALTSKEGDKYPTNKEPDCKLPAEKKSWKQVLKEWSNS